MIINTFPITCCTRCIKKFSFVSHRYAQNTIEYFLFYIRLKYSFKIFNSMRLKQKIIRRLDMPSYIMHDIHHTFRIFPAKQQIISGFFYRSVSSTCLEWSIIPDSKEFFMHQSWIWFYVYLCMPPPSVTEISSSLFFVE